MPRPERRKVLILEDDALFARSIKRVLDAQFDVTMAGRITEALDSLQRDPPDVVLLDMMLQGESGFDFLDTLRERANPPPVIVLTAIDQVESVVRAMRAGAVDYLTKPVGFDELLLALDAAVESSALRGELRNRRALQAEDNRKSELLGTSAAIEQIRREIDNVGPTDATVLIQGETGTGKELVARAIHSASERATGPFVAVNCGAIPRELFEAELFGHRKGAFTGADSGSSGKILMADKGTLLLDEVGELPLEAQVKLLRALEEQEFYPVGSNELVRVDTRVIASTHRDLGEMVEAGDFREDLYFRLNVFQIVIPPLRERPDDIAVLAESFLKRFRRKFRKEIDSVSDAALDALASYPWKGNVRELRNVLERAVLSATTAKIDKELVDRMLGRHATPQVSNGVIHMPNEGIDLEEVEKELMRQALEKTGGNKSKAARLLNLSPATFYYRLDKHGF